MTISRRTFVTSVVAGSALAAVGSTTAAGAASPPGDVVGKISVGYQGWFACIGDGAPINGWWHWSNNWGQPPSPSNNAIISWPDMREYTRSYQTAYANLGNGQPATLFSQYDQQTVDTHFKWMRDHGCDTAALQRFNPNSAEGATRDAMAAKVRSAAEAYGRKFYIMYDVTNWTNMQSEIKTDWTTKMSAHTVSTAYARQNGMPVVCVWGFGFNDPGRPFAPAACLDVVNWFKAQGCYVIGGVPTYWRQGINDSRPGFGDVYRAFHMLSPWMVGRTGTLDGLDWFYTNVNVPDQAECNARGIDYQPCVMPGDLSQRHRRHGDFMWRMFYNTVRVGAAGIYISMFDEYNEGNQIAKTAESAAWLPTNSGMLALDEDGTACSSDYYLRLTADGGRMLKGQLALTPTRPTPPTLGIGPSITASSHNAGFVPANIRDGNAGTYWESAGPFPQWIQLDLGAPQTVNRLTLKLPAHWGPRNQTIAVEGVLPAASYLFAPNATITFPARSLQVIRLLFTANTGWPAAQLSELELAHDVGGGGNLAQGKPVSASSHTQTYVAGNAVDGNASSYWESVNNAFPQWFEVDLGSTMSVSRLVLKLPPHWGSRNQTIAVDGVLPAASYLFAPNATINFPATSRRYLRLVFSANTGWPAAQLSELEVYAA